MKYSSNMILWFPDRHGGFTLKSNNMLTDDVFNLVLKTYSSIISNKMQTCTTILKLVDGP